MNLLTQLERWKENGWITEAEVQFPKLLQQLDPEVDERVLLAAAMCIYAQLNGHVCLDIQHWDEQYLFNEPETKVEITQKLKEEWLLALRESSLVSAGDELKPLILEEGRLYLQRFWKYEEELCERISAKAEKTNSVSEQESKAIRKVTAPANDLFETNWQHVAVQLSFLKNLVIISGGPGTGKTFTVLNIITAHMLANSDKKLRLALAAPTGKAARRLTESITAGKNRLQEDIKDVAQIPDKAQTIHKLLGANYRGSKFSFNEKNPLPYDLVIIDEASMLDITLWIHLLRALSPATKLIILGDKDQLSSVEAGSILGDLCAGDNSFSKEITKQLSGIELEPEKQSPQKPAINDSIVFLTKSYRFDEQSGIGKFAQAVNRGDDEAAISILNDSTYKDIRWQKPGAKLVHQVIKEYAVQHHHNYMSADGENRLAQSNTRKILCAVRKGPLGVEQINRQAERMIKQAKGYTIGDEWFPGRLVMATRNNALLKLRNGEIGLYNQTDRDEGTVTFEGEHAAAISTSRLTDYEPAFGITIHKSQGSEFDEIAIFLPTVINTILSKEILYTSVTRARRDTLIVAEERILRQTIRRSVSRKSGVRKKIWDR